MFRSNRFRAVLLGAFTLLASCSDLPTAPEVDPVAPQNGLLGGLVGVVVGTVDGLVTTVDTVVDTVVGVLSPILVREEPLTRDEVVTQTVGPRGGVIHLPRAGLTVTIPRGALERYTTITVKAPAGDLLAYEFLPHGLQFDRPLIVTQEVTKSEADGGLEAIYFEGEIEPVVEVLEVLPTVTGRETATFPIEHFSYYALRRRGYVVATD